jgi:peptide/nickel transport system permease protein
MTVTDVVGPAGSSLDEPAEPDSGSRVVGRLGAVFARAGRALLVLFVVSSSTFLLFNLLPGDAARSLLGNDATADQVARLRHEMRLDQPVLRRFGSWLWQLVQGDLGRSARDGRDVWDAIAQRLPITLEIMVVAEVIGLLIAIPIGVLLAFKAGKRIDRLGSAAVIAMITIPNFIVGFVLIFVFALKLHWLPATGFARLTDKGLVANMRSVALPALTIAIGEIAVYARTLRADLVQTLQMSYIEVATAKGLPTRRILFRHAFKPSSLSLVTLAGLNVARLIGGAVIVESLFGIPGVGQLFIDSITRRDIILLQGVVVSVAVAYIIINLLVDVLYHLLDPRLRHAG